MISQKLTKVSNSYTVNIFDNGYSVEISGRDAENDWKNSRVLCGTLEDLIDVVKEIAVLPQDD